MRAFSFLLSVCLALAACGSSNGNKEDIGPELTIEVQEDISMETGDDVTEFSDTPETLPETSIDTGASDPGLPDEQETTVIADCKSASGSYSMLAGVKIEFLGDVCSWFVHEALAGIEIPYQLVVEADVPFVKPKPQDAGGCGQPNESGLILFEELKGGQSHYCLCDVGHCAPPTDEPITVKKGIYPGVFKWDGLNWEGPSDTNNPKGKPFPPGKYTLTVSAKGQAKLFGSTTYQDFEVSATWPVELRPDPVPEEPPEVAADVPAQDFYIPAPDASSQD